MSEVLGKRNVVGAEMQLESDHDNDGGAAAEFRG